MLASTVQFSTNNQTPAHTTPPDPHAPTGTTAVRETGRPWTRQQPTQDLGWPVPSGPNSVPTTSPPCSGLRSTPTPQGGEQYWEPANRGPAELVSVPPSSTTPHAPPAPADGHRSRCGRGSGPDSGADRPQCSL